MKFIDQSVYFLFIGIIGITAIFSYGFYSYEHDKDFIKCIEIIGNEDVAVLKDRKQIRYFEKESSGKFISSDGSKDIIEFADEDKTIMKLSGDDLNVKFYVKKKFHENIYTLKNYISK